MSGSIAEREAWHHQHHAQLPERYISGSDCIDDIQVFQPLPRHAHHQCLDLLFIQLKMSLPWRRPVKFPFVKAPGCQPHPNAIMHQNLDPIRSSVGKDVRMMRVRRAKHFNDPRQGGIQACTHVHGFNRQPDLIDTYHAKISRNQCANALACALGQDSETEIPRPCSCKRISGMPSCVLFPMSWGWPIDVECGLARTGIKAC